MWEEQWDREAAEQRLAGDVKKDCWGPVPAEPQKCRGLAYVMGSTFWKCGLDLEFCVAHSESVLCGRQGWEGGVAGEEAIPGTWCWRDLLRRSKQCPFLHLCQKALQPASVWFEKEPNDPHSSPKIYAKQQTSNQLQNSVCWNLPYWLENPMACITTCGTFVALTMVFTMGQALSPELYSAHWSVTTTPLGD